MYYLSIHTHTPLLTVLLPHYTDPCFFALYLITTPSAFYTSSLHYHLVLSNCTSGRVCIMRSTAMLLGTKMFTILHLPVNRKFSTSITPLLFCFMIIALNSTSEDIDKATPTFSLFYIYPAHLMTIFSNTKKIILDVLFTSSWTLPFIPKSKSLWLSVGTLTVTFIITQLI